MFKGLDDINWEQFGEYHLQIGTKTKDIPEHVRNLLNEDPEERESAIQNLLGEGQHLGMLGAATPFIIPYILEVLADKSYVERGYLVIGLSLMCKQMFINESIDHLRTAIRVFDEIKLGFQIYQHLLNEDEYWIRLHIVSLLGYMQEHSHQALSTLLAQLRIETDSEVRVEIIECMIKLINDALSPNWGEGQQTIKSLYEYVNDNGTFDEQLVYIRALEKVDYSFRSDEDMNTFKKQILLKADFYEK